MIDAARVAAERGFRARPPDHRGRRRRGVRQHRRRRAGARVARRCARSSPNRPTCRSASRTRASRGSRWRRAAARRTAAGPRDGRDAILRDGPRTGATGGARSQLQARPPHPRLGTASLHASIIARRPRVEQLSGCLPAGDGAPHDSRRARARAGSGARGDPGAVARARCRIRGIAPGQLRADRRTRSRKITRSHWRSQRLPGGTMCRRISRASASGRMRPSSARRASRRCFSGPAGPGSTAPKNT